MRPERSNNAPPTNHKWTWAILGLALSSSIVVLIGGHGIAPMGLVLVLVIPEMVGPQIVVAAMVPVLFAGGSAACLHFGKRLDDGRGRVMKWGGAILGVLSLIGAVVLVTFLVYLGDFVTSVSGHILILCGLLAMVYVAVGAAACFKGTVVPRALAGSACLVTTIFVAYASWLSDEAMFTFGTGVPALLFSGGIGVRLLVEWMRRRHRGGELRRRPFESDVDIG